MSGGQILKSIPNTYKNNNQEGIYCRVSQIQKKQCRRAEHLGLLNYRNNLSGGQILWGFPNKKNPTCQKDRTCRVVQIQKQHIRTDLVEYSKYKKNTQGSRYNMVSKIQKTTYQEGRSYRIAQLQKHI